MLNLFVLLPFLVCLYEIVSMILPLKISVWLKVFASIVLLCGLAKSMIYRRTESGFDLAEMPYLVTLTTSCIFNFIIVAVFMLLLKDALYIIWKILSRTPFPGHYASLFVFSLALVSTVYGTYEGLRLPNVNEHTVSIKGLGREFEGLRVAVLVDIHADALTDRSAVQAIVERTNSLKPDVVLIPGDFVDGQVRSRHNDLEPLSGLKTKLGVYGSTGNHDYYYGYEEWMRTLSEFGVRMLTNEHVVLRSGDAELVIAGVPDPTGAMMGIEERSITRALEGVSDGTPIILMDHQPRDARVNAEHGVSLQLSGHTHGGQMPGIYTLVKRANGGYVRGWYDAGNMKLYVSPGTSQWNGFACRILDPSEITLMTLRAE